MKLSFRLSIIVLTSVIGLMLVGAIGLYALRQNSLTERRAEIENLLRMTISVLDKYHSLESSGKITTVEAQSRAAEALMELKNKDSYLFARDDGDVFVIHPRADRQGKHDTGAKLPDGRSTVELYRDELSKQGDIAFVTTQTAKPGAKPDDLTPKLSGVMRYQPWGWTIGTGFFVDDIDNHFLKNAEIISAISFLIIGLCTVLSVTFSKRIYRQLGGEPDQVLKFARGIAEGNLTQPLSQTRQGSILNALQLAQSSLRKMVSSIAEQSYLVSSASSDIHHATEEISSAALRSSEATSSTASAIEQMSVSIHEIASSAHEARLTACSMADASRQGAGEVLSAEQEIAGVAAQIDQSAELIEKLAMRTTEIGSIARVIKEIADQTNLLALNAAIEAARAGEQGRGFAVVADEVRKLAERTTKATSQIGTTIEAVQHDTVEVVQSMHLVRPSVARSVGLARSAAHALERIEADTQQALTKIQDIAQATAEQSEASNSIAANVERVASMLEETTHAAGSVNGAAARLDSEARHIHADIKRFQIE